MGRGSYLGGSTIVRPGMGWFSGERKKPVKAKRTRTADATVQQVVLEEAQDAISRAAAMQERQRRRENAERAAAAACEKERALLNEVKRARQAIRRKARSKKRKTRGKLAW